MRNVFIVLIAVLASSVALADGSTVVFKYVDSSGALSFTDDKNRVPEKYKARAEKVTLGSLSDYERFTRVGNICYKYTGVGCATAPESPRLSALRVANTIPATTPKQDCGLVTFRSERRDHDGFNSRFYIVEDNCGVLFDAPYYPELNSIRR